MKLIIDIQDDVYKKIIADKYAIYDKMYYSIKNGTPLTQDTLADLLMNERIRGELKQDISYSKDIIDDVKCRLTVDIIDRRPCYCGAELREVWRESEEAKYDI